MAALLRVIIAQTRARGRGIFLALLSAVISTGCVYRFTNRHIHRPEGIQTIAIEAVFDTSRQVLPHEILWEKLQAAFAEDGHLKIVPQSSADAIVRAHITEAGVSPSGTKYGDDDARDPDPFNGDIPPTVNLFRRMTQSETYRNSAVLNYKVEVEVYNLRTKTRLMRKVYSARGDFRALAADKSQFDPVVFLRYEEAKWAEFANQATAIYVGSSAICSSIELD